MFARCVCTCQRESIPECSTFSESARLRGRSDSFMLMEEVLDRSLTMVCLIDENYWTRLWCVFEVAAFY